MRMIEALEAPSGVEQGWHNGTYVPCWALLKVRLDAARPLRGRGSLASPVTPLPQHGYPACLPQCASSQC